jgi:hypothetical protein
MAATERMLAGQHPLVALPAPKLRQASLFLFRMLNSVQQSVTFLSAGKVAREVDTSIQR